MSFKKKVIKNLSILIAIIMIINFVPYNIIQSFAEEIGDSSSNDFNVTLDFQEIGVQTDLKIKVESTNGYTSVYDYYDLIDNKIYIPNTDCNITLFNGLNTEDTSDDIVICTINDLTKYSNLKSRYKIKWLYYPFDLTVEPATANNTDTTIRLVTYINGDMNVDGYLHGNDLLMLKQQLIFEYNVIQTGAYDGNFIIKGYNDNLACNNFNLNGNLYADNGIDISANGGNINGVLMFRNGLISSSLSGFEQVIYSSFDTELFLTDDDVDELYFENVELQDNISYPENTSNININEDIASNGTIDLVANNSINLNASIKADDNINISGEVHNANNSIIYSKKNITIQNDSTFSFTGMIYAPYGEVIIKARNVNITGTIIAKNIIIEADSINFNVNNYIINEKNSQVLNALQVFLGDMNNNGTLDNEDFQMMKYIILGMEYVNWDDKDGNNIPDILENQDEWKNYTDSDNDGLPDFLETYLQTDKMLSDTDNDGLSDYIEVIILNTNPCLEDTDDNGILDGNEDYDGDGLTNLEELEIGTDMTNIDTDGDGLDDYYEINISKTNPFLTDTDGNGIDDGDELFNQEVELEVNDEESAISCISVELSTQQKNYNVTSIESVMGIDIMSSNVVGLIGEPYNFTTEGDFSEATVTFKINPENLENTNFQDLAVLWYDEKTQCYELLDTQLNADTYEVSAITPHFSTGLVVDSVAWENAWITDRYNNQITWNYCDTALVIDCSGSTDSIRSNEIKAAQKFINNKMDNEKISIIAEDSGTTEYWGTEKNSDAKDIITIYNDSKNTNINSLTDSKNDLNSALNMMESLEFGGGNNFYSSLSMAHTNLKDSSSNKIIVFISDGEDNLESIKPIVSTIKQENIKIYTIGFQCRNYGRSILNYMSSETGGKFFEINDISELDSIYNTINIEKNMSFSNSDYFLKDSDNDGILDFYEVNGIRLANGQFINLSGEYENPQLNPDCDNDGLKDGIEITQIMQLPYLSMMNVNNQEDEFINRKFFYFILNSYPNNPDSDNDYYIDKIDTQKLHFDAMQIIDEKLNDDNSIDGTNPSADNNDYTDGILNSVPIDEGECSKNEYTFTRDTNKNCVFTITPQKNSDYTITISNPDCILYITGKKSSSSLDISGNQINSITSSTDSITYNLTLEKNVTYHIYIDTSYSTNLQYAISVSQDNWVYAPYGIYRSGEIYSEYSLIKDSVSISEYYIPDDIMYEIFRLYNDNSNQGEYWVKNEQYNNVEDYLLKIQDNQLENDEALKNRFNNVDAKFIINCLNQGYDAYINNLNSIGIGNTVGGIILMKVPVLGTGATLIGGGITYLNEKNNLIYKSLVDALVKGKYNIVIKNNKLNFDFYLKDTFEFSSWDKKNYVNKYSYNTRLQIKEIEKIEIIEGGLN